jgi:hypothetical protein
VLFPKEDDPLLPARWNFSVGPFHKQEVATPFTHETMPPVFQSNLFQPPHSLDSVFKAPELREWPLSTTKEGTVLIRSMEKIRTQEPMPDQVRGIFQVHLMGDSFEKGSFSPRDVFCVQIPIPQSGKGAVNIWMTKVEASDRGIMLRGQSEPMPFSSWSRIEAEKERAIPKISVQLYRKFSHACDWYSLGLLWLQALLGRDKETMARLENCLPFMIRGVKALKTSHTERLINMGFDPFRLLCVEQGNLFSLARLVQGEVASAGKGAKLPEFIWDACLELAFQLVAREYPSQAFDENESMESMDMVRHMEDILSRIRIIGEWVRLELFCPEQRRYEILTACQKVRLAID